MKQFCLMIAILIVMAALTGCASRNNAPAQNEPQAQAPSNGAQAETAVVEAPLLTAEEVAVQLGATTEAGVDVTDASGAPAELTPVSITEGRPVDLDLTQLSGTVVYSQVYDMMMSPDAYTGQKIKIKGNFNYYRDPDTKQEYFAAVIADATACCAQGIEFVWGGEHSYPRDYPPLDTEITVTGTFGTYTEDDYMYIRLQDADVTW